MTASEALLKARKKIEAIQNWFGGDNPLPEVPTPGDARLCAFLAFDFDADGARGRAEEYLRYAMQSISIMNFNDTHAHAEVLDAFDRAVVLAQAAGD
jgi:hypothetical protein